MALAKVYDIGLGVISIQVEFTLGQALDVMEQAGRKIYSAPVLDTSGELCDALRMHEIVSEA